MDSSNVTTKEVAGLKTLKFSLGIESEVKALVTKETQYDQRDFEPAGTKETLEIRENNGVLAGEVPEPEPEAEPLTQDTGPDREPEQDSVPEKKEIPPKVGKDREQEVNTKDFTQQESVSQDKPNLCKDIVQEVNTKDVTQQQSVSQEKSVTPPNTNDNVRDQEQSEKGRKT